MNDRTTARHRCQPEPSSDRSGPATAARTSRARGARKADSLRRSLAGYLFTVAPGEQLSPIRILAERFRASVGATQIALASLAESGAVDLDSRPGRGAVMLERHIGRLYAATDEGPLLVAMSLPSTERINGLATAIRSGLDGGGVEAYLSFIRGSRPRIAALAQARCQVAVMSRLAAEALVGEQLEILLTLPPGTFVREHRVFSAAGADERPIRRVAIDRTSYDFEQLTVLEFGQEVEYVPLNYLQAVREIEAGHVDAAILDVEDAMMRYPPDMPSRALSARTTRLLAGSNTSAALVGRRGDVATGEVVRACIDPAALAGVQREVIEGRRAPEY
jgi:YhfZ C-terminal domain